MKTEIIEKKIIHDAKWLKLVQAEAIVRDVSKKWIYCTRKEGEITDSNLPDAVVIVPYVRDKEITKIILVKEFRIPLGRYQIGFPAGLVDPDETSDSSAKRELLEETGYEVTSILDRSGVLATSAGLTDETFQYLFVEASYLQEPALESSEDIEVLKLSLAELSNLMEQSNNICGRVWPICYQHIQTNQFPI